MDWNPTETLKQNEDQTKDKELFGEQGVAIDLFMRQINQHRDVNEMARPTCTKNSVLYGTLGGRHLCVN